MFLFKLCNVNCLWLSTFSVCSGSLYSQILVQSCKHENWVSIAKYLTEEVPVMLASDNVKGIKDILVRVFASLPANFADFIKWVAEVRRQEDANKNLSEEERGRLADKVRIFILFFVSCLSCPYFVVWFGKFLFGMLHIFLPGFKLY